MYQFRKINKFHLITAKLIGHFNLPAIMEFIHEFSIHPELNSTERCLLDLRQAHFLFDIKEANQVIQYLNTCKSITNLRIVILADSPKEHAYSYLICHGIGRNIKSVDICITTNYATILLDLNGHEMVLSH